MRIFLLLLISALGSVGCSEKIRTIDPTAVVVTVDSDMREEIASLRLTVFGVTGEAGDMGTIDPEKLKFPASFTVAPPKGSSTGTFVVRVEGLDGGGELIVSVQARATFFAGKQRLMSLWLAGMCKGVFCPDDETCHYEVGDPKVWQCGDILAPKLTDYEPGADGDPSGFPTLSTATSPTETSDAGTVQVKEDAGLQTTDPDAAEPLPQAPNIPTLGSLRSLGARRGNSDNSLLLFEDGFEESRMCNPDGLCAVAGFVP